MLCTNIVLNVKRNKVDSRTAPMSIAVKKTIFVHNMFWTCIFLAMKWTISRHIVGYITLNGCKNEGFWKRFTRIFFALIVVFSKNMYLYVLRQKYRSECLAKSFSLYATRILFLLQLNVVSVMPRLKYILHR